MHMVSIDCTHSYPNSLAGVLERIDCATFPALWASRVRDLCGAQRIAAYRIRDGQARLIVAEGAGHGEAWSLPASRVATCAGSTPWPWLWRSAGMGGTRCGWSA